jgi:hypothetical protein
MVAHLPIPGGIFRRLRPPELRRQAPIRPRRSFHTAVAKTTTETAYYLLSTKIVGKPAHRGGSLALGVENGVLRVLNVVMIEDQMSARAILTRWKGEFLANLSPMPITACLMMVNARILTHSVTRWR